MSSTELLKCFPFIYYIRTLRWLMYIRARATYSTDLRSLLQYYNPRTGSVTKCSSQMVGAWCVDHGHVQILRTVLLAVVCYSLLSHMMVWSLASINIATHASALLLVLIMLSTECSRIL